MDERDLPPSRAPPGPSIPTVDREASPRLAGAALARAATSPARDPRPGPVPHCRNRAARVARAATGGRTMIRRILFVTNTDAPERIYRRWRDMPGEVRSAIGDLLA